MTKKSDIVRQALLNAVPIDSISGFTRRELLRALGMLTHDGDATVRQRACRELGGLISQMPPEKIKNYLRRLLWRLSPESGDYPVGTPELFGEIGHRAPREAQDFVGAFLYYLDDETLLPGLLQAAGRIGRQIPEALEPYVNEIFAYLTDDNPLIAGNAALALCRMGGDSAKRARRALAHDNRRINLFCHNRFENIKLCDLFDHSREIDEEFCFISDPEDD